MTDFPYSSIIWLTQNKYAIVDNDDYEKLIKYKWHAVKTAKGKYYANSAKGGRMQSQIIYYRRPLVVDHINGNGLDNRRNNLRLASVQENNANRRSPTKNTSGYKGVTRRGDMWVATCGGKYIGYAWQAITAAYYYDIAAREMYGEFAVTNADLGLL